MAKRYMSSYQSSCRARWVHKPADSPALADPATCEHTGAYVTAFVFHAGKTIHVCFCPRCGARFERDKPERQG